MAALDIPSPRPDKAPLHMGLTPLGTITFLYYNDLPRAARWYREIMQFPLITDYGWCILLRLCSGSTLGLIDAESGSQRPIAGTNKGAMVSLQVANIEIERQRFRRLGVDERQLRLISGCEGRTSEIRISDPEGYLIEIFEWLDPPVDWALGE